MHSVCKKGSQLFKVGHLCAFSHRSHATVIFRWLRLTLLLSSSFRACPTYPKGLFHVYNASTTQVADSIALGQLLVLVPTLGCGFPFYFVSFRSIPFHHFHSGCYSLPLFIISPRQGFSYHQLVPVVFRHTVYMH